MNEPNPDVKLATKAVLAAIRSQVADRNIPFLVAIDGGSGSGKSTLAVLIAKEMGAALVHSDDFFAANISDAGWDARTPAARAKDAINWRRLRAEALEPLLAGRSAKWYAFDFEAGKRLDGSYVMGTNAVECASAAVIVLDGAYSTRPELADLIDLSVLVDVSVAVRHERLAAREDKNFLDSWHARWDAAEEHYFKHVRPTASFDLVVTTAPIPLGMPAG